MATDLASKKLKIFRIIDEHDSMGKPSRASIFPQSEQDAMSDRAYKAIRQESIRNAPQAQPIELYNSTYQGGIVKPVAEAEPVEDNTISGAFKQVVKSYSDRNKKRAERAHEERMEYIARNSVEGIPLDVETGAPLSERLDASFRAQSRMDEASYWRSLYGDNVRRLDDGSLAVRVEKDGVITDLKVDEEEVTFRDLADAAGYSPQVAGDIAALMLLKRFMPGSFTARMGAKLWEKVSLRAGQALAAAQGGQAAAAATDVALNTWDDEEIAFWQTVESRLKQVPMEAAADLALGGVVSLIGNTFRKATGGLGEDARRAQFLADVDLINSGPPQGAGFEPTLGQITGQRMLIKTESLLGQVPASAEDFARDLAEQNAALKRVQQYLINGTPPTDREARNSVVGQLRLHMDSLERGVRMRERDVIKQANKEISDSFDKLSTVERITDQTKYALSAKANFGGRWDHWKGISDGKYDHVREMPQYKAFQVNLDPIAKYSKKQLKTGTVEVPKKTAKGIKKIKEKLPDVRDSNYKKLLRELSKFENGLVGLDDLRRWRSQLWHMSSGGEKATDALDASIRELYGKVTQAIEDSVSKLPPGSFKESLQKANKYYRDGIKKWQQKGIKQLIQEIDDVRNVDPIKFFSDIWNEPARYFRLKEIFGENTPQWKNIKRSLMDDLWARASASGLEGSYIKGKSFLKIMDGAEGSTRAILQDLFPGGLDKKIRAAAFASEFAASGQIRKMKKGVISDPEVRIPIEDVLDSAEYTRIPSVKQVERMIKQQEKIVDLYNNRIINDLASKTKRTSVNPAEFVDKFLKHADLDDFKVAWKMLEGQPGLQEQVRRKVIQDYFVRSSELPTFKELFGDVSGMFAAQKSFNLQKALGTSSQREVFNFIVGKDTAEYIEALIRVRRAVEQADTIGKMAGALVGGSIINNLMQNPITAIPKLALYKIYSIILRFPGLRRFAAGWPETSEGIDRMTKVAVTAAIFSETGVNAMIEEFGPEEITTIRDKITQWSGFSESQIREIVKLFEAEQLGGSEAPAGKKRKIAEEIEQYDRRQQN